MIIKVIIVITFDFFCCLDLYIDFSIIQMSSYWKTDDIVRIGETEVSIPSENGLSYSAGQKVSLMIPPSVKFLSGKDSYVEFDVKISLPAGKKPTRLQLDEMGASCLFENIRVYDGTRGNLIEEVQDYNTAVAVDYSYNADDSLRAVRCLQENATQRMPRSAGNQGTTMSKKADVHTNPYFRKIATPGTTAFADTDFLTAKCVVPLHLGCFQDKIFPCMMTSGLYLEFDLAPAERVIKQLDSVSQFTRLGLNPIFHGVSAAGTDWGTDGTNRGNIFLTKDNSQTTAENCPFVVGETIDFCNIATGVAYGFGSATSMSAEMTISEIVVDSTFVKIVVNNVNNPAGGTAITSGNFCLVSTSVSREASSYPASYQVSNFNLIAHQIDLDPSYEAGMLAKAREGKSIEFDIYSKTCYKHSSLASDTQATWNVFANNSRAQSMIVVPTDATIYNSKSLIAGEGTYEIIKGSDTQDLKRASHRSGYTGINDGLTETQYMIDGRLTPSRPVSTRKIATKQSIDAFHCFELEKSLSNAGIDPLSFVEFQDNFVMGRAFGLMNGAMDLRGKDLSVQLKYDSTITTPDKPKLYKTFVYHIRKLTIRGGAVAVEF